MLRGVVIALGVLLLVIGAVVLPLVGLAPALAPALFGALILLGTLFERRYRRGDDGPPTGPGWAPTGERFREPGGDGTVEVWYQQRTGRRRYVRGRDA